MRYVHFSRNPIIAKFLKAHKFVREFGEGVDRMYRELLAAGNPSPKYEQIAFMIVGTAYSSMFDRETKEKESLGKKTTEKTTEKDPQKSIVQETTGKTTEKILAAIRKNPYITTNELAVICNLTTDGIYWNMKKLKTAGLLTRIGPDKGGHWRVNDGF